MGYGAAFPLTRILFMEGAPCEDIEISAHTAPGTDSDAELVTPAPTTVLYRRMTIARLNLSLRKCHCSMLRGIDNEHASLLPVS